MSQNLERTTDNLPAGLATQTEHAPESMASMVWRRFRRHPGAVAGSIVLGLIVLGIILAPLSPYDPEASDLTSRLQPPSLPHPMGTDALGRDLFTRVLYGGRISLSVGLMVVMITLSVGVPIGSVAGYFGHWIDNLLMRLTDAALALPSLLVLILLSAILREIELPLLERNNVVTIAVVIGLLAWMTVARLVRASFLTIKEMDFEASSFAGTGKSTILGFELVSTIANTGIFNRLASLTAMYSFEMSTTKRAAGRRVRSAILPRFFSSLARCLVICSFSLFDKVSKVPSVAILSIADIFFTAFLMVGKLVSIPPGHLLSHKAY